MIGWQLVQRVARCQLGSAPARCGRSEDKQYRKWIILYIVLYPLYILFNHVPFAIHNCTYTMHYSVGVAADTGPPILSDIQSPPTVLQQQGQFFCRVLKTFG